VMSLRRWLTQRELIADLIPDEPTPVQVVTEHMSPDQYAETFMSGWDACLAQVRAEDVDEADTLFEQRLRQERYDLLCRLAETARQHGEHPPGGIYRWLDRKARDELEGGPVEIPTPDLSPFHDVLNAFRYQRGATGGAARDAFAYCASLLETALDQYKGDPT